MKDIYKKNYIKSNTYLRIWCLVFFSVGKINYYARSYFYHDVSFELYIELHVSLYIWDKVFKNGPRRLYQNFLKTVFHKFDLGHSWILYLVCHFHCVKSVGIRSYSGPHFPAFRLNTERYPVSLHIQSKCGKMGTRVTPNTDTFHAVFLWYMTLIVTNLWSMFVSVTIWNGSWNSAKTKYVTK